MLKSSFWSVESAFGKPEFYFIDYIFQLIIFLFVGPLDWNS